MPAGTRIALAALTLAAPLSLAQAPMGQGNVGGGVPYERGPGVERSASPISSREEALVPAASLGTLGKQADTEVETCIIRPVMTDQQLKVCGANPAALNQPSARPARKK